MKWSRSTYPLIFALLIITIHQTIIEEFYRNSAETLFYIIIFIASILIIIGLSLAIKDKELFSTVTDERTKKVDRSAGFFSFWFSLIFIFIFGIIAEIYKLDRLQMITIIVITMMVAMVLFHMYFNFSSKV